MGVVADDDVVVGVAAVFTMTFVPMRAPGLIVAFANATLAGPMVAVGEMTARPVVRDGAVVVRSIMELTLSCDHRILYGADAARFLARIREYLENPLRLAL